LRTGDVAAARIVHGPETIRIGAHLDRARQRSETPRVNVMDGRAHGGGEDHAFGQTTAGKDWAHGRSPPDLGPVGRPPGCPWPTPLTCTSTARLERTVPHRDPAHEGSKALDLTSAIMVA
jgi:hypothetical protein